MCKKEKIVVISGEMENGKPKIDFQNSIRNAISIKLNKPKEKVKILFLHCKKFEGESRFHQKKIKGASLVISTVGKIRRLEKIQVMEYYQLMQI